MFLQLVISTLIFTAFATVLVIGLNKIGFFYDEVEVEVDED